MIADQTGALNALRDKEKSLSAGWKYLALMHQRIKN